MDGRLQSEVNLGSAGQDLKVSFCLKYLVFLKSLLPLIIGRLWSRIVSFPGHIPLFNALYTNGFLLLV